MNYYCCYNERNKSDACINHVWFIMPKVNPDMNYPSEKLQQLLKYGFSIWHPLFAEYGGYLASQTTAGYVVSL